MHVDMLTAIAEADNFEIEFVPFETDKACLEALRDGEIDLVLGEIATKANSTGDFCVTDSLTSSQLCVIVANDMLQSGKSARTAICVSDTFTSLSPSATRSSSTSATRSCRARR